MNIILKEGSQRKVLLEKRKIEQGKIKSKGGCCWRDISRRAIFGDNSLMR